MAILTGTCSLGHLSTATVAAVTTTMRGAKSEVAIGIDEGLPRPCVVDLHHVHTIEQSALGARLTQLGEPVMRRVEAALTFALGFREPPLDE